MPLSGLGRRGSCKRCRTECFSQSSWTWYKIVVGQLHCSIEVSTKCCRQLSLRKVGSQSRVTVAHLNLCMTPLSQALWLSIPLVERPTSFSRVRQSDSLHWLVLMHRRALLLSRSLKRDQRLWMVGTCSDSHSERKRKPDPHESNLMNPCCWCCSTLNPSDA